LTLKHLEATYYTNFLAQFSQADFAAAGYNTTVYTYYLLIKNHEIAHVNTLADTINSLSCYRINSLSHPIKGGTPVPACNYTFPVTNVSEFIEVSRVLENTGVSAYDGAFNTLKYYNSQFS
jgi:hypothetical protein